MKRILLSFLTAVLLTACSAGCKSPSFGNSVSPAEEKQIGDWAVAQLQSTPDVPPDPNAVALVKAISTRLSAVDSEVKVDHVLVFDNPDLTITSLPGGWIIVSTAIVHQFADQPSILAGLLAHEYGHVRLHSSMQQLTDAVGTDGLTNMVTQGKYSEASNMSLQLMQLSDNVDDESKADPIGVRIASQAGYDPRGLSEAIADLQQIQKTKSVAWLRIHPASSRRLRRLTQDSESDSAGRQH